MGSPTDAGDDVAADVDPFDGRRLPVDDADELAGVVDLFGALTRREVREALVELAYRQRGDVDEAAVRAAVDDAVDRAVERYHLVAYAPDDATDASDHGEDDADTVGEEADTLLTVGPVSFPTLPAEADDLPHILGYPTRPVPREALVTAVEGRLRGDAARAVAAGDDDRVRELLDVTYDFEAWATVDVSEVRVRLDDALSAAESERESEGQSD
jgi:hypothetical protein